MLSVIVQHRYAYGWLDLRDDSAVSIIRSVIIEDQPDQNENLAHSRKRFSSAAARALLQYLFSNLTGSRPDAIRILKDTSGRPWVCNSDPAQKLFASLSHSGDLVSAAVDIHRPIGIDIEISRPSRDLDGIARRVFTRQIAQLMDAPADFYRCWCLYEAWIKAYGITSVGWRVDDRLMPLLKLVLDNDTDHLKDNQNVIFFPVSSDYTGCMVRGCPHPDLEA